MSSTTFIDLSHKLEPGMQIYPGDPCFACRPAAELGKDGYDVQHLSMGSHTGTHVDAPYHFVADGKRIDEVPLSVFVGEAVIVDLTGKQARERIEWHDLLPSSSYFQPGVVVLLFTGWDKYWGTDIYLDHPYLSREAAASLLSHGVKLIGTDTLSPDETHTDGTDGDFGVHEAVLGAGAIIAENLANLGALSSDRKWMVSLVPLNLFGCDGSPVRALAWAE